MDPLSALSGVVGLLDVVGRVTITIYQYLSAVKDAPKSCEKLLQELFAISGTLTNAKYVIEDLRNQDPTKHGRTVKLLNQLDGPDGPMQRCRVTLDDLLKWLSRDGKSKMRLSRRALWPIIEEKEAMEFITALERHKTHFTLVLSLSSAEQLLALRDTALDIREEQQRVKEGKALRERQKTLRKFVDWLTPLDVSVKHETSVRLRQPGTGGWLIQNELFKGWRSSSSSLLWLNGIPGNGKTILMSTVIDELKSSCGSDTAFVYYYCDFSDRSSVNPVTMLKTFFCAFLTTIDCDWTTIFGNLFEREELGQSPPSSFPDLRDLVMKAIGGRKVIIVLDALDECTERSDLLGFFPELVSKANVRLMIASRKEHDIYEAIGEFPTIQLKYETQNVEADMRVHVIEEVRTRPKLARLPSDFKDELVTTLLAKADRMFRWIQCQLDFISTRRTRQGFQEALNTLPRGLNPTYERILSAIDNEGEEAARIAKQTLVWLVGAVRPLTLQEIMDAITVEKGLRELNHDVGVLDSRDILEICSGLVDYDPPTGVLALSHHSVQEFLHSNYLQDSPLDHYYISVEAAHRELALLTLTYLMFDTFADGPCETLKEFNIRIEENHLFQYAGLSWYTHIQHIREDDIVFDLLETFTCDQTYREQYLSFRQLFQYTADQNFRSFDHFIRKNLGHLGPLYHSILNSHLWVIRRMIERRNELLNEEITPFGPPLILASHINQPAVANLLLELGAAVDQVTVNHYAGFGQAYSALYFAIEWKYVEVFECLLNHGASLYLKDGPLGDSFIFVAGYSGSPSFLTELIKRGLNVEEKSREGATALHYAVQGRSLPSVQVLVEAGCNVNEEAGNGKTPLQMAFDIRSNDIIQFLLDNGANAADLEHVLPEQLNWAEGEPWFPVVKASLKIPDVQGNSSSVQFSVNDVLRTKTILKKWLNLPIGIVREILDLAEYWVCTTVTRKDPMSVINSTEEKPYVLVPVKGRRDAPPLRKVVFETRSHDQGMRLAAGFFSSRMVDNFAGWSDKHEAHNSYRWSDTWFEAGSIPEGRVPRRLIQVNVHASLETRTHVNTWDVLDGIPELTIWLEAFSPGDVLAVYPKARYPGWKNYIEGVRVDVYCAWA